MPDVDSAYTCPKCRRESYNPNDAAWRFCVSCGFEELRRLRAEFERLEREVVVERAASVIDPAAGRGT